MIPETDSRDCQATLYHMMGALKQVLLEKKKKKRKENLVRVKKTIESTQIIKFQNIDF
jgi:hypothetical protein